MNILVTGGAGFIGSHTVVALTEAGFNPVVMDDYSNSNASVIEGLEKIIGKPVKVYAQDCNDAEMLRRIIIEEKIEGVIHFAAFKAVGESMEKPLEYYRNNLCSLITMLEVMLETGVSNLIFSSSCTVYGEPDTLPVTEATPIKPASSVYGNTKQIGEQILWDAIQAGKLLKIISLRYFNPVGAHPSALIGELPIGPPANLVPYVTQTAAGIRTALTVHGNDYSTPDGSCIRDYIHVMDLAEAHVAALKYLIDNTNVNYYDVFNLGTGAGFSVLDIIQTFEAVSGVKLSYKIGPRRPGDVVAVYADVTKAKNLLHWTAKRTVREALADAWRWQTTRGLASI